MVADEGCSGRWRSCEGRGKGEGDRHCLVVDETLHTGECLNRKGVRVVAAVIKAPK